MAFEYFIGRRYLRARRRHRFVSLTSFLAVAGVCVGVMALIVVIAVMEGFEADLKSRILGVESDVVVTAKKGTLTDYGKALARIRAVTGVKAATAYVGAQVMIRSTNGISGAMLRGIDPQTVSGVIHHLDPGALAGLKPARTGVTGPGAMGGIILGRELARNIGAGIGDVVHLISPRGSLSPFGYVPALRPFRVLGLFESGMYEVDSAYVYIHLTDAQNLLRMPSAVSGIQVRVKDIDQAQTVAASIGNVLGPSFECRDWGQMNRNLFSALQLEKTVMFIILTLIVLVAALNIASTLIMMVMEKTRDIAILKAMGASDQSIWKIFVFKGMSIGAIGTGLGSGLGFLLCWLLAKYRFLQLPGDVYYITTLPVDLRAMDVGLIAVAALTICFLATLYPARQAARLNAVEAIRYG
jgi:lipoprotein-releasing system permease protein